MKIYDIKKTFEEMLKRTGNVQKLFWKNRAIGSI